MEWVTFYVHSPLAVMISSAGHGHCGTVVLCNSYCIIRVISYRHGAAADLELISCARVRGVQTLFESADTLPTLASSTSPRTRGADSGRDSDS